jgi:hypothetical protein
MNDFFFDPLVGIGPLGDDHEPGVSLADPTSVEVHQQDRWQARAAQWRACVLAKVVFEGGVGACLAGQGVRDPFRGFVEHREREGRFLAAAGRDPLLARIPFLFVFGASRSACTL